MLGAHLQPHQVCWHLCLSPHFLHVRASRLARGESLGHPQVFLEHTHHPGCVQPHMHVSGLPGSQGYVRFFQSILSHSPGFHLKILFSLFFCFNCHPVPQVTPKWNNSLCFQQHPKGKCFSSHTFFFRTPLFLCETFMTLTYSSLWHFTAQEIPGGENFYGCDLSSMKHQAYTCLFRQLHSSPYLGPQRISTWYDFVARNFWFSPDIIPLHFQQLVSISYVPVRDEFSWENFKF